MTEPETWDDINERVVEEWKAETTPFERVYEVVEGTREGQSAVEVAERAHVSEPTARRHLKALVETGFAETERGVSPYSEIFSSYRSEKYVSQ